jgi:transposase
MRKYQTEFKPKMVKSFLDGNGGTNLLARQSSVPEERDKREDHLKQKATTPV